MYYPENPCTNKLAMVMISSILMHISSYERDLIFLQTLYGLFEFIVMPNLRVKKNFIKLKIKMLNRFNARNL